MDVRVEYIDSGRGQLIIYSGEVTGQGLLAAASQKIQTGDEFTEIYYSISDMSRIDSIDVRPEDLKMLGEKIKGSRQVNADRVGVVVAPTDLTFGLARMFEMHQNDFNSYRVFRSMDAAHDWIREKVKQRFDFTPTFE